MQGFLLAHLGDQEADEVEKHLLCCDTCCRTARTLETDDPLLDAVQQARAAAPGGPESVVVERLIEQLRPLRQQLDGTAGATPRDGADPAPAPPPDATDFLAPARGPGELGRVGSYSVVKVLGSGGMGIVFQARQARPQRLVALKMILAGPRAGGERLARFRSETEVVARLRHPNIVAIYEAGEHDGRPYYTMELLEGGSLAQKLAATPLEPRAVARLLETVAGAVHHAHEQGVVHRDLKPSNVLLAADGTPKVTDFGLAKSLEGDGDPAAACRTETGAILGTPAYMAPEQAGGGKGVGPAADVYALGVILYEALTGRPPFRAATVLETLEQVRSCEPVPPGRLQPGLPHDLQTICLKCLEKEPARRYASARELADDLGRFLRDEPIQARPAGFLKRLAKWVRRRPALAALAAVSGLFLVTLLAGVLLHNVQLREAARKASDKEAEALRQQQIAADNYRQARDTINRMLARLEGRGLAEVPRLKELSQEQLEDALGFYQLTLEELDNPDAGVRRDTAVAYQRAADIQQTLRGYEVAAENYGRAIRLLEGLPAEDRDAPDNQALLAGCHANLGKAHQNLGRWDEAERHYRIGLEINERAARERPDDPHARGRMSDCEHNLGSLFQSMTRLGEAEPHYIRAVALRTRLVHDRPDDPRCQVALAESYVNLASIYMNTKRPADANATYEKIEALLPPLVRAHPDRPEYSLPLAAAYTNWSYLLHDTGRPLEGLRVLGQAVDYAEAVLRREPNHAVGRQQAASAHGSRAQLNEGLGHLADAVKDWDRVVELDDRPNPWINRALRAVVLARAGDHARALAEVTALEVKPEVNAEGIYALATACALAVEAARGDSRLSAAERTEPAERCAARGVALLRKLQEQGYFKDVDHASQLGTDPDLRGLRGRADFPKPPPRPEGTKPQ